MHPVPTLRKLEMEFTASDEDSETYLMQAALAYAGDTGLALREHIFMRGEGFHRIRATFANPEAVGEKSSRPMRVERFTRLGLHSFNDLVARHVAMAVDAAISALPECDCMKTPMPNRTFMNEEAQAEMETLRRRTQYTDNALRVARNNGSP